MASTTVALPPLKSNLDLKCPVIKRFDDGEAVNNWVAALRRPAIGAGGRPVRPTPDIIDRLKQDGWTAYNVMLLVHCTYHGVLPNISYSNISRGLDYHTKPVVKLRVSEVGSNEAQVVSFTVTQKEANLFHGEQEGVEARLFLNPDSKMPSQLLMRPAQTPATPA